MELSDLKCLIVDFAGSIDRSGSQLEQLNQSSPIRSIIVGGVKEAKLHFESGVVSGLGLVTNEMNGDVSEVLQLFQQKTGCFPDHQMIFCDDPDPDLMMNVFEYGVEQFTDLNSWVAQFSDMVSNIAAALSDQSTTAYKCFMLNAAVKSANQNVIHEMEKDLSEDSDYDPVAAFSRGKALEAVGNYGEALKNFENAEGLNSLFRPAQSGVGEALLLSGEVDKAIEVFNKMEVSNASHGDRKLWLANAYTEKGDLEKANQYLSEAQGLKISSSKMLESKILILLASKKVGEAVKLMDQLTEIGPHLASKLNALGVSFSQAGKVKTALTVYKKAHKIVKKELRYKVSLNAALACHRGGHFDIALKYLSRCEKEYGSTFPKLEKIKRAVAAAKNKKAS